MQQTLEQEYKVQPPQETAEGQEVEVTEGEPADVDAWLAEQRQAIDRMGPRQLQETQQTLDQHKLVHELNAAELASPRFEPTAERVAGYRKGERRAFLPREAIANSIELNLIPETQALWRDPQEGLLPLLREKDQLKSPESRKPLQKKLNDVAEKIIARLPKTDEGKAAETFIRSLMTESSPKLVHKREQRGPLLREKMQKTLVESMRKSPGLERAAALVDNQLSIIARNKDATVRKQQSDLLKDRVKKVVTNRENQQKVSDRIEEIMRFIEREQAQLPEKEALARTAA